MKKYLIRTSRDKSYMYEIIEVFYSDDGHSRIVEVVTHANTMRDAESQQEKLYEKDSSSS